MNTMTVSLPTAAQLEKLPLRAVVAYAARNARRLSSELRGIVADEVLDRVLQLVESVSTIDPIANVDKVSVIRAAERITGAYADAPNSLKSLKRFRIVFSLAHAATAAAFAILAAARSGNASFERTIVAQEAQYAVHPVEALSRKAARAAMAAARYDYDVLLRKYGEHEEIVVGEPVHCFDVGYSLRSTT
jgi:hypothetical protein